MAKVTLKEMKEQADLLGIQYPEDVKFTQLKKILKEAGEDRQEMINSEPQADVATNDFDISMLKPGIDTRNIKIAPDKKDYEKNGYDDSKLSDFKKKTMLVRCKVMILDPSKATEDTISMQIWNAIDGKVAGRVIPVGKDTHVEKAILDSLENEKYSFKIEKEVEGDMDGKKNTIIETVQLPKYGIQILPKLTQEELNNLADDQRKTDRLKDN